MAQQARGSQRAPGDDLHRIDPPWTGQHHQPVLLFEMENLSVELIPEADHFYTHQRKFLWSVVSRGLEKCR